MTNFDNNARSELMKRVSRQQNLNYNADLYNSLDKLDSIVQQDFANLAKQAELQHFIKDLGEKVQKFRFYCELPEIRNKQVIAIGGKFSAGKSSFLNTLTGKKHLAVEIDPTTSIPTYLLKGCNNEIIAINNFYNTILLTEDEFKSLTHEEQEKYGSQVGSLLKSVFITDRDFRWQNLAFLDTPGYTKPEDNPNETTDADIAHAQLNSADYIIWLVSAEDGGIKEDDLAFLESLDEDIPKLVLITKSDRKTENEIADIVQLTKNLLENSSFEVEDVLPISRKVSDYPLDEVLDYFDDLNQETESRDFGEIIFDEMEQLDGLVNDSDFDEVTNKFFEYYNHIAKILNLNPFEVPNRFAYILDCSLDDRLDIASSETISEGEAKVLAEDEYIEVRVALARNPNVSEDIIGILLKEENEDITLAILSSQKLEMESLKESLSEVGWKKREAVAKNPFLTEEIQLILANDEDDDVRASLSENITITEQVQSILFIDDSKIVRNNLSKNINVSECYKEPETSNSDIFVNLLFEEFGENFSDVSSDNYLIFEDNCDNYQYETLEKVKQKYGIYETALIFFTPLMGNSDFCVTKNAIYTFPRGEIDGTMIGEFNKLTVSDIYQFDLKMSSGFFTGTGYNLLINEYRVGTIFGEQLRSFVRLVNVFNRFKKQTSTTPLQQIEDEHEKRQQIEKEIKTLREEISDLEETIYDRYRELDKLKKGFFESSDAFYGRKREERDYVDRRCRPDYAKISGFKARINQLNEQLEQMDS